MRPDSEEEDLFVVPTRQGSIRKGGGTLKFVYQKWPDQIFLMVNFVIPHYGHFGLGWGWGGGSRVCTAILILPWQQGAIPSELAVIPVILQVHLGMDLFAVAPDEICVTWSPNCQRLTSNKRRLTI